MLPLAPSSRGHTLECTSSYAPRRLAQVPAMGHAGAPEPAWSSHCTASPPHTGSSSTPPSLLHLLTRTPFDLRVRGSWGL